MLVSKPDRIFRITLYSGASLLLCIDLIFLLKALFTSNVIPIVPLLVGILIATALLFLVYAEQRAREEDKRDHRRIARVAHQLESPLRSLEQDLSSLTQRADGLPAEERLKLKRMETKTKVLLDNVRDVFLMLQAAEHSLTSDVRLYNLCTLVEEAVRRYQDLARAHNVELVYAPHCQDAPIAVDRRLFLIALSHIIENAVLYSLTPGYANIAVTRGKASARIIVQDRGLGISKEDARAVFRPFARGSGAEKFDPDGIGVGLTLAQEIIHEVGGTIRWRNRTPNLGAEFSVELPLATTT